MIKISNFSEYTVTSKLYFIAFHLIFLVSQSLSGVSHLAINYLKTKRTSNAFIRQNFYPTPFYGTVSHLIFIRNNLISLTNTGKHIYRNKSHICKEWKKRLYTLWILPETFMPRFSKGKWQCHYQILCSHKRLYFKRFTPI